MLSISLSLVAAFTPLIFMDGIVGRLLREFSLTLTFAIVVSTVVSLTITPMICAHYIKEATSDRATWFDRLVEGTLSAIVRVLRTGRCASCSASPISPCSCSSPPSR